MIAAGKASTILKIVMGALILLIGFYIFYLGLYFSEKERFIMALFGKKNKEKKITSCCCDNCDAESMAKAEAAKTEGASVKILGSGCAKCNRLEAATKAALEQLSMDTDIDHVTDFSQIAAYGVMTTPALVVDGKVVSYGKVLKTDEVVKLLQKARG